MSSLGAWTRSESHAICLTDRLRLRHPQADDYGAWAALRAESRDFLVPWEATWPADDLTRTAFRRRLRQYADAMRRDEAYPFFVFSRDDDQIMGGITMSNVRRGVAQSCSLGYWIGARFARRGYMSEAVRALVGHIFLRMGFHRIEAACIPSNEASRKLLLNVGFREEGYARRYLKINGQWQDHLLFALLRDDTRP